MPFAFPVTMLHLTRSTSLTINRPRHAVYGHCRQIQNLVPFMHDVERIVAVDERRSRWLLSAAHGPGMTWDTEIVEDQPGEQIRWRTPEMTGVRHEGVVRFVAVAGGHGTKVHVDLRCVMPAGEAATIIANRADDLTAQLQGLRRFKRALEASGADAGSCNATDQS